MKADLARGKSKTQKDAIAEVWRKRFIESPHLDYRPVPQARRFHRSQARWRFLLGGNRSSKSHALAMETLWASTGCHPWRKYQTPNEGWYATTTWDKVGDTLWGPKLDKLLHGIPHETAWHNKQRNIPEIVFVQPKDKVARKFWSKIVFKAFEQGRESFQATAMRWIHNDEQFGEDVWIEENSRIGGDHSLDIACAFTPIDPQPWLEGKLTGKTPAGWDVFELPLDDNRVSCGGFIDDALIDAMIELWPPEVRQTRRRGKWGSYLGTIFQTFNRAIHVVDQAKEDRLFRRNGRLPLIAEGAIDWGGANPFVFLWGCRIPWMDNDWYIFDEYYWASRERGVRRLEQHATEIKMRGERWGVSLDRIWADHDPTDANEFFGYGIPSNPAVKDVRSGIEHVQTLLNPRTALASADFPYGRPRLHISERCEMLLQEIATYRWAKKSSSMDAKDPRDEPLKVGDHSVDAARYLLFSDRPFDPFDAAESQAAPQRAEYRYQQY